MRKTATKKPSDLQHFCCGSEGFYYWVVDLGLMIVLVLNDIALGIGDAPLGDVTLFA